LAFAASIAILFTVSAVSAQKPSECPQGASLADYLAKGNAAIESGKAEEILLLHGKTAAAYITEVNELVPGPGIDPEGKSLFVFIRGWAWPVTVVVYDAATECSMVVTDIPHATHVWIYGRRT